MAVYPTRRAPWTGALRARKKIGHWHARQWKSWHRAQARAQCRRHASRSGAMPQSRGPCRSSSLALRAARRVTRGYLRALSPPHWRRTTSPAQTAKRGCLHAPTSDPGFQGRWRAPKQPRKAEQLLSSARANTDGRTAGRPTSSWPPHPRRSRPARSRRARPPTRALGARSRPAANCRRRRTAPCLCTSSRPCRR